MGVRMSKVKRLEKLRIWRPGAASRTGPGAARQIPGAGEGRGGRISEFQIFRKRTLRFSGQGSLNDKRH